MLLNLLDYWILDFLQDPSSAMENCILLREGRRINNRKMENCCLSASVQIAFFFFFCLTASILVSIVPNEERTFMAACSCLATAVFFVELKTSEQSICHLNICQRAADVTTLFQATF